MTQSQIPDRGDVKNYLHNEMTMLLWQHPNRDNIVENVQKYVERLNSLDNIDWIKNQPVTEQAMFLDEHFLDIVKRDDWRQLLSGFSPYVIPVAFSRVSRNSDLSTVKNYILDQYYGPDVTSPTYLRAHGSSCWWGYVRNLSSKVSNYYGDTGEFLSTNAPSDMPIGVTPDVVRGRVGSTVWTCSRIPRTLFQWHAVPELDPRDSAALFGSMRAGQLDEALIAHLEKVQPLVDSLDQLKTSVPLFDRMLISALRAIRLGRETQEDVYWDDVVFDLARRACLTEGQHKLLSYYIKGFSGRELPKDKHIQPMSYLFKVQGATPLDLIKSMVANSLIFDGEGWYDPLRNIYKPRFVIEALFGPLLRDLELAAGMEPKMTQTFELRPFVEQSHLDRVDAYLQQVKPEEVVTPKSIKDVVIKRMSMSELVDEVRVKPDMIDEIRHLATSFMPRCSKELAFILEGGAVPDKYTTLGVVSHPDDIILMAMDEDIVAGITIVNKGLDLRGLSLTEFVRARRYTDRLMDALSPNEVEDDQDLPRPPRIRNRSLMDLDREITALSLLSVHEAYQGQGLGRRLYKAAREVAKEFGKGLTFGSESAPDFYKRMGIKVIDELWICPVTPEHSPYLDYISKSRREVHFLDDLSQPLK